MDDRVRCLTTATTTKKKKNLGARCEALEIHREHEVFISTSFRQNRFNRDGFSVCVRQVLRVREKGGKRKLMTRTSSTVIMASSARLSFS